MGALISARWSSSVAALVLALGCASPFEIERGSELSVRKPKRVVVLPFEAASNRMQPQAAEFVTSRILAELSSSQDLIVVSPIDVRLAVEGSREDPRGAVVRAFAPDALLGGSVRRFQGDSFPDGTARGPAAVEFEVWLEATDGTRLWRGHYTERQRMLSEDLGALGRSWARGFAWVAPERLAADAAAVLVDDLVGAYGRARERP